MHDLIRLAVGVGTFIAVGWMIEKIDKPKRGFQSIILLWVTISSITGAVAILNRFGFTDG